MQSTPDGSRDFAGRTVVVTGAASGIGAHTAGRFAERGANVIACDIRADVLRDKWSAHSGVLALEVDVTSRSSLRTVVEAAVERFGAVDVWINNATVASDIPLLEMTEEQVRRDVDVNLFGGIFACQEVLPTMLAQGRGVILNLASVNAVGYYGNDAYSAAKAGLISLTRGIAMQFGRQGVRCVAVAPGSVATEVWADRIAADPAVLDRAAAFYPAGRVGTVDDIASLLLFLASDEASWITGTTITIDGGLTAGNEGLAKAIAGS